MIYEIINPSDKYTIETKELDVALVACLFLGNGQYAFEPLLDGGVKIPLFLFGGTDEWCIEHCGASLEATVENVTRNKALVLAACFESCLIGGRQNRQTYFDGLALIDDPIKREEWRRRWHDERLSSMNDIGGRAYAMAKRLREGSKNPLVQAPQQVFAS